MKSNNIKNVSSAIRESLNRIYRITDNDEFIFEINTKLNRLVHNQFITKKLLEQFFVNEGFKDNLDLKSDSCLSDFYEKNNSYKNNFLG